MCQLCERRRVDIGARLSPPELRTLLLPLLHVLHGQRGMPVSMLALGRCIFTPVLPGGRLRRVARLRGGAVAPRHRGALWHGFGQARRLRHARGARTDRSRRPRMLHDVADTKALPRVAHEQLANEVARTAGGEL